MNIDGTPRFCYIRDGNRHPQGVVAYAVLAEGYGQEALEAPMVRVQYSVAACNPADKFLKGEGRRLALERLIRITPGSVLDDFLMAARSHADVMAEILARASVNKTLTKHMRSCAMLTFFQMQSKRMFQPLVAHNPLFDSELVFSRL